MAEVQEVLTPEQVAEAQRAALQSLSRPKKLELFLQLCQQGTSVPTALKQSGICADYGYDPTSPNAEVEIEELFYQRCQAKIDKSREKYPYAVFPDVDYDPSKAKPGDLTTSQLYALVDWLYFVKALPFKAIATSLQIPVSVVSNIKAELSSEFARAVRNTQGDGYIGDLLRSKDLLRADLLARRAKLGPRDTQAAIQIDKLLWELENTFLSRLQEIGLIDKHLGKVEISEEWHVTIDAVSGAPINKKLEPVSQGPFPEEDIIDLDSRQISDHGEDSSIGQEPTPGQLLAASRNNATIRVGDDA